MKIKLSQMKIGALLSYFSIGFNIIAGLLYTPWMIDKIGQSDYGLYTLANSLISLFLLDFGLSAATSRFVAKYRAENDEEGLERFLGAIYKLYIIIDAVIFAAFLVIFFCIDNIYQNLTAEELSKFKVIYSIAAVYSVISFPCVTFKGILTAYEKFVPLKSADLFQRVGTVAFTVIALLCGMGLYALVTVNAIWGLLAAGFKFYYVRKSVGVKFVKNTVYEYKSIFGHSLWSTVWSLADRLVFNITPTIIGITVTAASSAIAVFGIVSTIEGYFYTITTAINGMFLSRITKIVQDDPEGKKITALAVKVGRFQLLVNGLIVLGFLVVGKEFILLWMGEEYISAYYGILLVVLPGLFYNALQIANTTIIAQGMIKYQAYIHIAVGFCNVVLSFAFSRLWGVLGASLSIFAAYTLRTILTLILIKKKTNINLKQYFKECYAKMLMPFLISFMICIFTVCRIDLISWKGIIIKGIAVVLISFANIYFFGTTKAEKSNLIKRIVKR